MFTLLSPQKAKNSEGYIVQVADRHSVEYIGVDRTARVFVDFGETVGLYSATLTITAATGLQSPINSTDQAHIIERIKAGLEAMGSKVEVQ